MVVQVMSKGAYLHVKDGLFEVLIPQSSDSKTHVSHQYAVSHVQSIWIHTLASISTAALHLAIEHDIDFVLCDWRGMPLGRFMPHRPNTTAAVQKAQLIISQTPHAITYVKTWINQKLDNQMSFLQDISDKRKADARELCKTAIKQIKALHLKISVLEGQHISEVALWKVFENT